VSERVERIRELWGAADPSKHRAPQLIRDVQFLLGHIELAERALSNTLAKLEESVQSIGQLRATLERHEQDHMAAMSEAQSREQALTAERDELLSRVEDLKRSADASHLAASNECARANAAEFACDGLRAALEGLTDAIDYAEGNRGVFSCSDYHDTRCPKQRADSAEKWKGEWKCECYREELDAAVDVARAALGRPANQ
jgi:chromosome segregation ATPase